MILVLSYLCLSRDTGKCPDRSASLSQKIIPFLVKETSVFLKQGVGYGCWETCITHSIDGFCFGIAGDLGAGVLGRGRSLKGPKWVNWVDPVPTQFTHLGPFRLRPLQYKHYHFPN